MSRNAFHNLSDEALLDYYHSTRNLRAFRQLYSRHKDSLYRYCAQMHFPSAASVVEQLWHNLLERPPELCGRLLRNWLFIRASQMLGSSEQMLGSNERGAEGDDRSWPHAPRQAEPAAVPESNKLLSAMQQLPRIERNILLLHMECRLPLATVADIERISLSKCRALYQQGKDRLREILHGPERQPWRINEVTL